jgi:hypothetical protein
MRRQVSHKREACVKEESARPIGEKRVYMVERWVYMAILQGQTVQTG